MKDWHKLVVIFIIAACIFAPIAILVIWLKKKESFDYTFHNNGYPSRYRCDLTMGCLPDWKGKYKNINECQNQCGGD